MIEYIFKAINSSGEVVAQVRYQANTLESALKTLDDFSRENHVEQGAVRITADFAL